MGIACTIQYLYLHVVITSVFITSIGLYENSASHVDQKALINAFHMLRRKWELLFPELLAIANGKNV